MCFRNSICTTSKILWVGETTEKHELLQKDLKDLTAFVRASKDIDRNLIFSEEKIASIEGPTDDLEQEQLKDMYRVHDVIRLAIQMCWQEIKEGKRRVPQQTEKPQEKPQAD